MRYAIRATNSVLCRFLDRVMPAPRSPDDRKLRPQSTLTRALACPVPICKLPDPQRLFERQPSPQLNHLGPLAALMRSWMYASYRSTRRYTELKTSLYQLSTRSLAGTLSFDQHRLPRWTHPNKLQYKVLVPLDRLPLLNQHEVSSKIGRSSHDLTSTTSALQLAVSLPCPGITFTDVRPI